MKRILLLISSLIISIATAFAATGQLNAYAYGASYAYNPETQTFAVNWSLPSEASAVRIVAVDAQGNKYVLKQYSTTRADAYNSSFSIWEAVDADKLPRNEDLRVEIEVKTASRNGHEVISNKKFTNLQSPFSIDIDNNPYSKYFGLKYVTQMDANKPRGVYIFDQTNSKVQDAQIGTGITLRDDWYDATHGVPHMVRVIPDGSGRLLVTHADKSQDTYLWLVEPNGDGSVPTYPTWKTVITNEQMVNWTGLSGARFANAGLDIRSNGDNWDIVLYTADANKYGKDLWADKAYSGVYSVPQLNTNLTNGTYTSYTKDSEGIINQTYTQSMMNAGVNFDKYGGVLYNAHTDNPDFSHTGPALKHRTLNGGFKQDYEDGKLLQRTYVATKGVRFNQDFTKIAIAQNASKTDGKELRIYDVVQADGNSHPEFINGVSVDVITESSIKAYVHDIAWDYGKNVYITVRNQTTKVNNEYMHGIYAVALDLNGEVISTPVQDIHKNKTFRINCSADQSYTITLNQQGGTGTLTGAGTYASCTEVTVTAKPDNQYKFIKWTENGNEVSKSPTYTFRATKDRTLTAVFEPAVYNNITWWNLFENGEDISSESINLSGTNERLWRWLQIEYNNYLTNTLKKGEQLGPNQNDIGITNNQWMVIGFFKNGNNSTYNSTTKKPTAQEIRGALQTLLDDSNLNSKFYWLGQYIENCATNISINNTESYFMWGYYLQAFINRLNYFSNISGGNAGTSLNGYTVKQFATYGHPDYWRPYWTESVCGLQQIMTYNDAMPTDWNKPSCAEGEVVTWDSNWKPNIVIAENPSETWYKWNNVNSSQNGGNSDTHILAWRKDGVKGPIITRVEGDNWKLYATYVKKHIHEDDPEPDMSGTYPQDATNSDVFRLLFNKTWDPNYAHKLTITRKIQGGMYNTICFPFKVYLGDNGSMPNDNPFKEATYWKYIGTDSKYNESGEPVTILDFEQETEVLEAGIPYLVWSDNDITKEEILFGVPGWGDPGRTQVFCDTVPKTVPAREGSPIPITFVGTINPTEVPAESLILVADNRLAQTTTKGQMKGMRGYFTIDPMWAAEIAEQAADGRVYLSMKKPVTTSIPVAPEAEQQTKPEVRKIMRDGQIYILRGDEVYTITGNRVK